MDLIKRLELVEQEGIDEKGAGTLQGLPPSWIKKLTDLRGHAGVGGESSEVKKIGEFQLRSDQLRSNALSKLIDQAKPAADITLEDGTVVKSAQLIGLFVKSDGQPFALINYDPEGGAGKPYSVMMQSGEQIKRLEKEPVRSYGRRRYYSDEEREVEKVDLNMTQLTALLPTDVKLEVYAVYSDLEREKKREERGAAKQKSVEGDDLKQIRLDVGKKHMESIKPDIAELFKKVPDAMKAGLEGLESEIDKVYSEEKYSYDEVGKFEQKLDFYREMLRKVYNVVYNLRYVAGKNKDLVTKERDWHTDKYKLALDDNFKRLRDEIEKLKQYLGKVEFKDDRTEVKA